MSTESRHILIIHKEEMSQKRSQATVPLGTTLEETKIRMARS
jgi:hypothetical protein